MIGLQSVPICLIFVCSCRCRSRQPPRQMHDTYDIDTYNAHSTHNSFINYHYVNISLQKDDRFVEEIGIVAKKVALSRPSLTWPCDLNLEQHGELCPVLFLTQTSPGIVTARFFKEGMGEIQSYHSEMQSYHLVSNPITWQLNPIVWCAMLSFGFLILILSSAILSFSSLPNKRQERCEYFSIDAIKGRSPVTALRKQRYNNSKSFKHRLQINPWAPGNSYKCIRVSINADNLFWGSFK